MAKPKTPHQIATQRVAAIQQWLAADESTDANESTVARAMREFGITHRDEAKRLVSRAAKSFAPPITGGRPKTHARLALDMRQPVYVSQRSGNGPIESLEGKIIAATSDSITVLVGDKTIRISASNDGGANLADWFNDAP